MKCSRASLLQLHGESSELVKELSFWGFGDKTSDHLLRWTILDQRIFHINAIGDEVKSEMDVFGSLAA